jgi:hypothetical protein
MKRLFISFTGYNDQTANGGRKWRHLTPFFKARCLHFPPQTPLPRSTPLPMAHSFLEGGSLSRLPLDYFGQNVFKNLRSLISASDVCRFPAHVPSAFQLFFSCSNFRCGHSLLILFLSTLPLFSVSLQSICPFSLSCSLRSNYVCNIVWPSTALVPRSSTAQPWSSLSLCKTVRAVGSGFTVGQGEDMHGYVRINDFAQMYGALLSGQQRREETTVHLGPSSIPLRLL